MVSDSFFCVIEGIDGAGKTSIARQLHDALSQTHRDLVALTYQPHDDSVMGQEIRAALSRQRDMNGIELAQAFALNRSNHLKTVIEPHLQEEQAVLICDRYLLSSLVYQTRGIVEMRDVYHMNRWALVPHLTIVLQVEAHIAYQRMDDRGKRARELFENDLPTRLKKYEDGIALLREKGHTIVEVDGNGAITDVFNLALDALKHHKPPWLRIQPPLILDS